VPKKLIEVALPLEAINREAAREKSIRHGHPSTLHLWWARRPLAACRAVLFASIVDDPSSRPEEFPTEEAQDAERQRLFRILEELVKWENSNDERVLQMAREEIRKATGGNPPPVLDPFCGGGSIPLEAQRLGLEAYASDLNPVAVLITKALIEIPPRFAGRPPVNPEARAKLGAGGGWTGAKGLAEDVRYYGRWMRERAEERIGHLYPKVKLPRERGGGEATVIAWLWARTVRCPNPACGAQMPLVRSFWLSTKPKGKAWVEPIVDREAKTVRFEVHTGDGGAPEAPKLSRGAKFRCIVCGQIADEQHIKAESCAGRMGAQLMAIVAESRGGRVYLPPNAHHANLPVSVSPREDVLTEPMNPDSTDLVSGRGYGFARWSDLFTARQLVALTTFSDLVTEAREQALKDAIAAGLPDDGQRLEDGGTGAPAYADAIATYLAFAVDRGADQWSSLASWRTQVEAVRSTFARQALPMVWDFTEINPFSDSTGNFDDSVGWVCECLRRAPAQSHGWVQQLDATSAIDGVAAPLIATDPPYYDNIGYADLSDFFYVWLRRSIGSVYPDLFSTLLTPKDQELVATPYRFGGDRRRAERFFEEGLAKAFERMREAAHPEFPVTLFYAFKQAESAAGEGDIAAALSSTGWETMLTGLLRSGFAITGTWPMRTERGARSVGIGTNALASSVVLVCRPRLEDAPLATRQEFVRALRAELPEALRKLQHGSIAPVDLAQAAIGPGMAVFSRYSKVVEADGSPMRVGTALGIINQVLAEVLTEQDEEYDPETRWAVAWFEQYGMGEGKFGDAEILSKAKDTAVDAMERDGFLRAKAGKVALVPRDELPPDWDPATDRRLTVWEVTQHLIRALEEGGEMAAADLLRRVGGLGEIARDLAYRLYTICERKGWAQEALAYNALVVAWPEIVRLASGQTETQPTLLGE
jgi:putative DNA methylase